MSGAYQLFIRAITLTGLGFISYEIYESYKQEKRIRKLQAQRQYQISTGKEVDPRIEQEIDHYLDNHYGQRVLERMASRNVFEEQLRMQIQSKKDQRDQAKETGSEDQVKKLDDDIKKLNDLLGEVKSNKAVDVDSYGTMK